MQDLKIAIIYFSATHVTKTYAEIISKELLKKKCTAELIDITPYSARQKPLPLNDFDSVIFGFPVFGDFAPSIINEWLPTLNGNGKECVTFFTYGARSTGYAHFHTMTLLEKAGFSVQFTAEFPGRHTFNIGGWNILPERPDEKDFAVAREFADLAIKRFSDKSQNKSFTLQKPFAYNDIMKLRSGENKTAGPPPINPYRFTETCSMCRECETECPNKAFNADTGLADSLKCISCMHCVYICPDKVLKITDKMKGVYPLFLKDWNLTEEMMQKKKSKIITDSSQAAF